MVRRQGLEPRTRCFKRQMFSGRPLSALMLVKPKIGAS